MNFISTTESGLPFENPSVPAGMRKCLRPKCPNSFVERGPKLYCSPTCSKAEYHRRLFIRDPERVHRSRRGRGDRYRASHPEFAARMDAKATDLRTSKRRGMSKSEFEARILAQGNRCPIGNHEFSSGRGFGYDNPARDHCHETGKDRAILCQAHNLALGLFKDSPEAMQTAMNYLRDWREKHLNDDTNLIDNPAGFSAASVSSARNPK